jgi:hypothetical protein
MPTAHVGSWKATNQRNHQKRFTFHVAETHRELSWVVVIGVVMGVVIFQNPTGGVGADAELHLIFSRPTTKRRPCEAKVRNLLKNTHNRELCL